MIAGNIHLWLDGTNMAFPNRCLAVVRSLLSIDSDSDKRQVGLTKQINFRKTSKGGRGVIFNVKIYVADFRPQYRLFFARFQKKIIAT